MWVTVIAGIWATRENCNVGVSSAACGQLHHQRCSLLPIYFAIYVIGRGPQVCKFPGLPEPCKFLLTSQEGMFHQEETAMEQSLLGSCQDKVEAEQSCTLSQVRSKERPQLGQCFIGVSYRPLRGGCALGQIDRALHQRRQYSEILKC